LSSETAQPLMIETDGVGDSDDQGIMTHDEMLTPILITTQYWPACRVHAPNEANMSPTVPVTWIKPCPVQTATSGMPVAETLYKFIWLGTTARRHTTRHAQHSTAQCWQRAGAGWRRRKGGWVGGGARTGRAGEGDSDVFDGDWLG
jgi:hypothetical protein